eukprot:m.225698 g.225698  ORF g.225698 m.225698 type:complete len:105 (+) comp40016_c0_seq51:43-357(+)
MAAILILAVSLALLGIYFFYKADRNFTMYLWSRKAGYYKDKVVWVTGASSGSQLYSRFLRVDILCILCMPSWPCPCKKPVSRRGPPYSVFQASKRSGECSIEFS